MQLIVMVGSIRILVMIYSFSILYSSVVRVYDIDDIDRYSVFIGHGNTRGTRTSLVLGYGYSAAAKMTGILAAY